MLPGLKAVLNLHPLFVHFPIGLWIGALIFEIIAVLRKSDDWHRTGCAAALSRYARCWNRDLERARGGKISAARAGDDGCWDS